MLAERQAALDALYRAAQVRSRWNQHPPGDSLEPEALDDWVMRYLTNPEVRAAEAAEQETEARFRSAAAAVAERYLREAGGRRARMRAGSILYVWVGWLPRRVANEDLGDYLEDMDLRVRRGQKGSIYLSLIAAIFWTGLNAIGYAMKAVGKRKAR